MKALLPQLVETTRSTQLVFPHKSENICLNPYVDFAIFLQDAKSDENEQGEYENDDVINLIRSSKHNGSKEVNRKFNVTCAVTAQPETVQDSARGQRKSMLLYEQISDEVIENKSKF